MSKPLTAGRGKNIAFSTINLLPLCSARKPRAGQWKDLRSNSKWNKIAGVASPHTGVIISETNRRQVYHMCDGLGRQFSYSCPNTTLFQQRMLICDHWYMVNCSKSLNDYDANLLIVNGRRTPSYTAAVPGSVLFCRTQRPYHRALDKFISIGLSSRRRNERKGQSYRENLL
ncbi:hypothetical protein EVAR_42810_1 [Eumeta japonica]|uniref:Chitin-binding type-2 domain-containing protein n=1 Tax=Eumeta variegata TaxID=151549 RepID=A0A4C1WIE6_EUMVA|nr:hypothetical protein EVAR_42810_1 [Eumeta japonica]